MANSCCCHRITTAPCADGYMAAKSQTHGVVFGVRGFQSAGGTAQAVSLMKTTKIYPLSRAANPAATVFVNGSRKEIDTIFSDTGQYFADLAWMIDREPLDTIPSHERFQLAAIGIEKGKAVHARCPTQGPVRRRGPVWVGNCAHQQLRLGRPGASRLSRSRLGVGVHRRIRQLGLAGLRQHRPPFRLRVHRDRHVAGNGREACGHRLSVSVDAARRERSVPRRQQDAIACTFHRTFR